MLCCELESTVDDLASELKQDALEEIREKKILGNAYVLTRCANPYSLKNMVIIEKRGRNITEIYYCGELVFLWRFGLRKYICGDWTDELALEVRVMRAQRSAIINKDRAQVIANNHALKNYVMC
jgi:hypothetical protein